MKQTFRCGTLKAWTFRSGTWTGTGVTPPPRRIACVWFEPPRGLEWIETPRKLEWEGPSC